GQARAQAEQRQRGGDHQQRPALGSSSGSSRASPPRAGPSSSASSSRGGERARARRASASGASGGRSPPRSAPAPLGARAPARAPRAAGPPHQPRLADARLAADERDGRLAPQRALEGGRQYGELLLPADEDRRDRSGRHPRIVISPMSGALSSRAARSARA